MNALLVAALTGIIFFSIPNILILAETYKEQPEDSITYWKPFEVTVEEDPAVQMAQEVFQRLLSVWDDARLTPDLHVVRSDSGPWAASLDDGNILLSLDAITLCLAENPKSGGTDRLAFVLAHELAHQKADHLWHRRYFRLANKQPPLVKGRMLKEIGIENIEVSALDAKETQADRDGLTMLAVTGFDPYNVAGSEKHFFEKWVESVWGDVCSKSSSSVCKKAQIRAESLQAFLLEMANQTTLFDLGIQSLVAEKYESAREFFVAFGRENPRREVFNNIALTFIGEAGNLKRKVLDKGGSMGTPFMFMYLLDEDSGIPLKMIKRGATRSATPQSDTLFLRKQMKEKLSQAEVYFEKAIKVSPGYREVYLHLAAVYLQKGNAPLAYGLIAGKYIPLFGEDSYTTMLLGIAAYLEGDTKKAEFLLRKAAKGGDMKLQPYLLANLAAYLKASGDNPGWKKQWKKIARIGQKNGDEFLFTLALKNLGKKTVEISSAIRGAEEKLNGYKMGEKFPVPPPSVSQGDEIWVNGEKIQIYSFKDATKAVVDSDNTVIALWNKGGRNRSSKGIKAGDSVKKVDRAYGYPGRRVDTVQGEYRVFKNNGIAFTLKGGKIEGWFLF